MAKLSDIFLNLLQGTLEGGSGMTPRVKAELALRQSDQARQNLSTLSDINQNYNQVSPGFVGPLNEGSFTPNPDQARLVGLAPGTSLQPISRKATVAVPNLKTGTIGTQSFPLQRGETFQETNPFTAALLGQQKNYLDQATALRGEAKAAQEQISQLVGKLDPGISGPIMTSIASGILPENLGSMFKDPYLQGQIATLTSTYKTKSAQADALMKQGMGLLGGPAAPAATPAETRPAPPAALSNVPPGHMAVWNRTAHQFGFIPTANFNPLLHEQVGSALPAPAGVGQ